MPELVCLKNRPLVPWLEKLNKSKYWCSNEAVNLRLSHLISNTRCVRYKILPPKPSKATALIIKTFSRVALDSCNYSNGLHIFMGTNVPFDIHQVQNGIWSGDSQMMISSCKRIHATELGSQSLSACANLARELAQHRLLGLPGCQGGLRTAGVDLLASCRWWSLTGTRHIAFLR